MSKLAGIRWLFSLLIGLIQNYRAFIPAAFSIVVIVFSLVFALFASIKTGDYSIFLEKFVNTIFAADYNIYLNVQMAIQATPAYTVGNLLEIGSSLIVLFYLAKYIGKALILFTGSQAQAMAYVAGFIILGIFELSAVRLIDGIWFFPYKGFITLLIYLPEVFRNINWSLVDNFKTDSSLNTTIIKNATFKNITFNKFK